ncbi:MAG: response regulator [Bacteroidota bacterium]
MRPHLLLIDDDEEELKILTDTLAEAGVDCKCTWATSPMQALDMLHYLQADFIFIDYHMPKMNGIECISHVRQLPSCQHIPVILYSSELNDQLIKQANDAGIQSCLKKTSDTAALIARLRVIFTPRSFPLPAIPVAVLPTEMPTDG